MVGRSPFEMAGLLTHLVAGVDGLRKALPLPRGPHSGLGLTPMAPETTVLVVLSRLRQPGEWIAAATDAAAFAVAPWLLASPASSRMRGAKDE